MDIKKGKYKNIIELAKANNTYDEWSQETSTGKLEDYLNDYSDRNIVLLFLSDVLPESIKYKVAKPKWEDGGYVDWTVQKVEVF